jgi:hypothetical protein
VENAHVESDVLAKAAGAAAARRCAGAPFAYVPVDKSSLWLGDYDRKKGFGMIGTSETKGSGLHVLSALAVTPDGVPQGVAHQHYWTRPFQKKRSKREQKTKPLEERESYLWLEAMASVVKTFETEAPGCKPWFQIDREGDVASALVWAVDGGHYLTVRGKANRRLMSGQSDQIYLYDALEAAPLLGSYDVEKSARPGQAARKATVDVRSARVTLSVPIDKEEKRRRTLDIGAILVREPSPPAGVEAIEWLLLTTRVVESFEDVRAVVAGYTQRWRIEEFHRAWKSGACRVEDSQLRAPDHVVRWATLLASVAVRIIRLAYLARTTPDAPASVEFGDDEVKVISTLARPRNPSPHPTVGHVIRWIADLGGYTGPKVSGGPAGFIVLARGLDYIQPALRLLERMRET